MAMYELREAILAAAREDIALVGELVEVTEDIITAWNTVCEASPTVGIPEPISEEDYYTEDYE